MATKRFINKNFMAPTLYLIDKCNIILDRYNAEGYDMTLRQLYYQLVSSDEIPNNQREYNRLGVIVNDARLAGLIDWNYIVDRTRNLKGLPHWDTPKEILDTVARQFRLDRWDTQVMRPEVWIEKDALAGVFERVCNELDVPFFACRGYTSQSEMYGAAQRYHYYRSQKQIPYILHFGDHDPSGIDMSRDIQDRLKLFGVEVSSFERMALNMNQVQEFKPPPNPAKLTDSRCQGYIKKFGDKSWELDALPPDVLANLVRKEIKSVTNQEAWAETEKKQMGYRIALRKISDNFDEVARLTDEYLGED